MNVSGAPTGRFAPGRSFGRSTVVAAGSKTNASVSTRGVSSSGSLAPVPFALAGRFRFSVAGALPFALVGPVPFEIAGASPSNVAGPVPFDVAGAMRFDVPVPVAFGVAALVPFDPFLEMA